MFDDVCLLISERFEEDELAQQIPVETSRQVLCTVGNITRAEFFEAGRNGLKPAIMLKVFRGDYEGESVLEFHDERYNIYRTYATHDEQIELYAERRVGIV